MSSKKEAYRIPESLVRTQSIEARKVDVTNITIWNLYGEITCSNQIHTLCTDTRHSPSTQRTRYRQTMSGTNYFVDSLADSGNNSQRRTIIANEYANVAEKLLNRPVFKER